MSTYRYIVPYYVEGDDGEGSQPNGGKMTCLKCGHWKRTAERMIRERDDAQKAAKLAEDIRRSMERQIESLRASMRATARIARRMAEGAPERESMFEEVRRIAEERHAQAVAEVYAPPHGQPSPKEGEPR